MRTYIYRERGRGYIYICVCEESGIQRVNGGRATDKKINFYMFTSVTAIGRRSSPTLSPCSALCLSLSLAVP